MTEAVYSHAPEPTVAAPGTQTKEMVLIWRCSNHYQLFHPADARYEGDILPYLWLQWKRNRDREASKRLLDLIKSKKGKQNGQEEARAG